MMKKPRIFYGWFILAIALLTATIGYSILLRKMVAAGWLGRKTGFYEYSQ